MHLLVKLHVRQLPSLSWRRLGLLFSLGRVERLLAAPVPPAGPAALAIPRVVTVFIYAFRPCVLVLDRADEPQIAKAEGGAVTQRGDRRVHAHPLRHTADPGEHEASWGTPPANPASRRVFARAADVSFQPRLSRSAVLDREGESPATARRSLERIDLAVIGVVPDKLYLVHAAHSAPCVYPQDRQRRTGREHQRGQDPHPPQLPPVRRDRHRDADESLRVDISRIRRIDRLK